MLCNGLLWLSALNFNILTKADNGHKSTIQRYQAKSLKMLKKQRAFDFSVCTDGIVLLLFNFCWLFVQLLWKYK